MNLEIVTAAQQIEPLLRAAARRGQGPRTLFKRALRAQQNKLSYQDWFWLLISLQALRSAKAPAIYMPAPSPFVNETPAARRARHLRRWRQVQAGNVEAPPEIPGSPADAAGLGAAVPPPGAGQ